VDLLQVDHRGEGVQLFEYVVGATVDRQLSHRPRRVSGVAEGDGPRRAALRTRRGELVWPHSTSLRPRPVLGLANALDAEGALLHDALAADGDVRVELPVERLREGVLAALRLAVAEPVEVADLVGAVVGAVARAHAAVVDLDVEPVRRVVGGVHRADRLARCVAAVLAEHRHEARLEIGAAVLPALEVALEAEPGHLATLEDVRAGRLVPRAG